jgi:hypothetical protein
MKQLILLIFFIFIITLIGCVTSGEGFWAHKQLSGLGRHEVALRNIDRNWCAGEANKFIELFAQQATQQEKDILQQDVFDKCMVRKGWEWVSY